MLGEGFGFGLVELFVGAFEEGGDVSHAENAAYDAVGVEGFEGVGLFAGAEELDGLAGDLADGEGGAAAGVAVHFGEDGAGDGESLSLKALAELTASWPVMASATKRISVGLRSFLSSDISSMRASSMPRRPAVSTMRMSQPKLVASRRASLARRRTAVPVLVVGPSAVVTYLPS